MHDILGHKLDKKQKLDTLQVNVTTLSSDQALDKKGKDADLGHRNEDSSNFKLQHDTTSVAESARSRELKQTFFSFLKSFVRPF